MSDGHVTRGLLQAAGDWSYRFHAMWRRRDHHRPVAVRWPPGLVTVVHHPAGG